VAVRLLFAAGCAAESEEVAERDDAIVVVVVHTPGRPPR